MLSKFDINNSRGYAAVSRGCHGKLRLEMSEPGQIFNRSIHLYRNTWLV